MGGRENVNNRTATGETERILEQLEREDNRLEREKE